MADVTNKVVISKTTEIFPVPEVTARTPVFPTAAQMMVVRDPGGSFEQNQGSSPNDEIKNTRSRGKGFVNEVEPGTFKIPAFIRPSGVVGKAPDADAILEAGWGKKEEIKGLVISANAETFDLADGETLLLKVDGGSEQTVTFGTGDFVDIDAATAQEIVDALNAAVTGMVDATASVYNDGTDDYVQIQSDTLEGGSVQITGGTANAVLGFDTDLHTSYIKYSPSFDLPTICMWVNKGEMAYAYTGCLINELTISLPKEGGLPIEYSGFFSQRLWCGKANLAASSTTTVMKFGTQDEINRYCELMHVSVGDSDDHEIIDVDYDAFEMTISPALSGAPAEGTLVKPYLPSGVELGEALAARKGDLQWAGSNLTILSGNLFLKNNAAYDQSEKTASGYPENYFSDWRDIGGSAETFFKTRDLGQFRSALEREEVAIGMLAGDTPAKTAGVVLPVAETSFPAISEASQVKKSISFNAIRTDKEDEAYMYFGQP